MVLTRSQARKLAEMEVIRPRVASPQPRVASLTPKAASPQPKAASLTPKATRRNRRKLGPLSRVQYYRQRVKHSECRERTRRNCSRKSICKLTKPGSTFKPYCRKKHNHRL